MAVSVKVLSYRAGRPSATPDSWERPPGFAANAPQLSQSCRIGGGRAGESMLPQPPQWLPTIPELSLLVRTVREQDSAAKQLSPRLPHPASAVPSAWAQLPSLPPPHAAPAPWTLKSPNVACFCFEKHPCFSLGRHPCTFTWLLKRAG